MLSLRHALLGLVLLACSAPTSDEPASASAEGASTAGIRGRVVKKLGPAFARPVQGIASETDAQKMRSRVEDDARLTAREDCAATLGVPLSAVSTKLVGLASAVTKELGDFLVTASTQQTYCSTASLDGATLVTFDGRGLESSGALHAGRVVLVDPNLTIVADDVSQLGHTAATRAHLMARFDGGAFREVSGTGGVTGKAGATIDVEAPFEDVALLVDLPPSADRIEIFFRVERWNVTGFFEDGNFTGTLVSPAPDGFVSNFGSNYRVPVSS